MLTLPTFTSILLLAFLSFSVQAFPFPLSLRDVVAPKIIEPDASSVWPIGSQQMVIWDTSGFPSQVTNPIAQVILGFNENDSLNLDFDHPLAQNFKLTDGKVAITVPNVPPRDNYLICLFGDSGDTSSIFAITSISSPVSPDSSSSSPSSSSAPSDSTDGATLPSTSLSTSSPVTTPTTSTDITSTNVDTPTVLPPSGTTTTESTSSSSASSSVSNSASALAASSSSAGWSLHRGSSLWNSAAPYLTSVAPFLMVFMV